jgi:hypothetical protein
MWRAESTVALLLDILGEEMQTVSATRGAISVDVS